MDKGQALRAGLWSSLDVGCRLALQLAVAIGLARILSPADFGVYALTGVFVGLSAVFVDGGFTTALIQRREVQPATLSAVFCYNVGVGAIMAIMVASVGRFFADIYGHPILEPILYVTAFNIFIGAFGSVPGAILARRLEFDRVAKAGLASSFTAAAAALLTAWFGAGVWALVVQAVCSTVLFVPLLWGFSGWWPKERPHFRGAGDMARFGSLLTLTGLLEAAYANGYPLVIGKLYGASDVGYYNRGQNLQGMPSGMLSAVVQRVALPLFSRHSGDPEILKGGAKEAIAAVMLINLPVMALLGVLSDGVIFVLYGEKWLLSAPILTILALAGALYPLHVMNIQIVLAKGRSDIFLRNEIIKKVIGILCIIAGSMHGIVGLAWSQLFYACVAFFINARPSGSLIGYGPLKQLSDLLGLFALAATMVAILIVLQEMFSSRDLLNLIVLSLFGVGLYGCAAIALNVGTARSLAGLALEKAKAFRSGSHRAKS